jgi:hypothetical protein
MSDPDPDDKPARPETTQAACTPARREGEPGDDEEEEKILAGRINVNMPALLTKDVQGG